MCKGLRSSSAVSIAGGRDGLCSVLITDMAGICRPCYGAVRGRLGEALPQVLQLQLACKQ